MLLRTAPFGAAAAPACAISTSLAHAERVAAIETALARIEAKLDSVLAAFNAPAIAARQDGITQTLLAKIDTLAQSNEQLYAEYKTSHETASRMREAMSDLAHGADRFLAGLTSHLSEHERDLFFAVIATVPDGGGRRVQTFSEIASARGVTKQAIHKAYRKLSTKHPSLADYVQSIRNPQRPSNFSELSPSARRDAGVDPCYDHPVG
jgi:hypothetical protein